MRQIHFIWSCTSFTSSQIPTLHCKVLQIESRKIWTCLSLHNCYVLLVYSILSRLHWDNFISIHHLQYVSSEYTTVLLFRRLPDIPVASHGIFYVYPCLTGPACYCSDAYYTYVYLRLESEKVCIVNGLRYATRTSLPLSLWTLLHISCLHIYNVWHPNWTHTNTCFSSAKKKGNGKKHTA